MALKTAWSFEDIVGSLERRDCAGLNEHNHENLPPSSEPASRRTWQLERRPLPASWLWTNPVGYA